MPTILECCGITMPETIDGQKQSPLHGVSMRYSFDDGGAPTTKETQYYEMVGTRGIWHKGWKASTVHAPMPSDQGNFDKDQWQLFHTDVDRAEAHDLAGQHPEKVKELAALWLEEAKKNRVLPLTDVSVHVIHELEYHATPPADGRFTYYPGTTEIPEASAARTLGSSFKILAEVELTGDSQGIICSQGSRFGGYALFVKGGNLVFTYNFLGIPPEQRLTAPVPALGEHIVGVEFKKESLSKNLECLGTMTLFLDEKAVATAKYRTQTGHFSLCGEGLCIGYDSGDAVSSDYKGAFPFTSGKIIKVIYDVGTEVYTNVERQLRSRVRARLTDRPLGWQQEQVRWRLGRSVERFDDEHPDSRRLLRTLDGTGSSFSRRAARDQAVMTQVPPS